MTGPRYAIYFAPQPDAALWSFGSAVLGYDAATGLACQQLRPASVSSDIWSARTSEPRRYGFHATLKAPFHLKGGMTEALLVGAVHDFAAQTATVHVPALEVAAISSFVALIPRGADTEIQSLAASVVEAFERFRAPLTQADLARRLYAPLTDRERSHLMQWGYPYVMECFRFHMTLSGALPAEDVEAVRRELDTLYELQVGERSLPIASVALFKQETRDTRFTILARAALAQRRNPEAQS